MSASHLLGLQVRVNEPSYSTKVLQEVSEIVKNVLLDELYYSESALRLIQLDNVKRRLFVTLRV